MACAPTDQPWLDYEREEQALIDVLAAGDEIVFDGCDLGTLHELGVRVADVRPHIVHLQGHGTVTWGIGQFAFETEEGTTNQNATTREIVETLAGAGVEVVFISACQSGQAPATDAVGGICAGLVGAGIPAAIGWAASVDDYLAGTFARVLYERLARGVGIDQAFRLARRRVRELCEPENDASWTLPVLYAATTQDRVWDRVAPREQPRKRSLRQEALPGISVAGASSSDSSLRSVVAEREQ
jgi:hypothetical protein